MCLNVKRFTKSYRNRYLFPAIITLYNCSKPKWRMIENMNCKINLLEIVCCIQTVWYWTDLVLQGVNLILKRHNLKNKKTDLYDSVLLYFMCVFHHLCQAPCKRTHHCWMLHVASVYAHPVAFSCVFLGVVASVCTPLSTRQQHHQTDCFSRLTRIIRGPWRDGGVMFWLFNVPNLISLSIA